MATGRRRKKARAHARPRERSPAELLEIVSSRVHAMEVPLREATRLCRAVEIAYRPLDDEMEALAFVAGEAHTRLEFVGAELNRVFKALRMA